MIYFINSVITPASDVMGHAGRDVIGIAIGKEAEEGGPQKAALRVGPERELSLPLVDEGELLRRGRAVDHVDLLRPRPHVHGHVLPRRRRPEADHVVAVLDDAPLVGDLLVDAGLAVFDGDQVAVAGAPARYAGLEEDVVACDVVRVSCKSDNRLKPQN